jgi:site-specific DNA-methyltransferase (adenine-specific)
MNYDNLGTPYKTDKIVFYNCDCMELLRQTPDKYYDLCIVDPPYGINMDGGKIGRGTIGKTHVCESTNYTKKNWDKEIPKKEYFNNLKRVSKNQIIFGANHFIENIHSSNSSCWIVWDKLNTIDFADCELAYTSFKTAVRKFSFMWNGMLQGDMKNKEMRIHPTQKPIRLYTWLLSNYAKAGDKILDTHVGSASSLIACHQLGFDVVGCELDKEYYDMAKQRIENETLQLKIEF